MRSSHRTRLALVLVTTMAGLPAAWSQASTGGEDDLDERIEQVAVGVRSDRAWQLPSQAGVDSTPRAFDYASPQATCSARRCENWCFSFTPFLWVPGVSGDVKVGPATIDVDASIGDVFDAIVDNFEFAAMGRLEARHGRWGIAFNLLYLTLGNQETGPLGFVTVDWDFELTIAELFGMYRFATVPLGCGDACFRPTLTFDALAGARYVHSETKLAFTPGPNVDGSTDFVDPVVGLRAMFNVTPALSFRLMGNVGGFGVGSEFSWQAYAGVEWKITPCFSLDAGWAVLAIDSEAGTNDFDLTLSGPGIGATFRF